MFTKVEERTLFPTCIWLHDLEPARAQTLNEQLFRDLDRMLAKGGEPLNVVAVEKSGAEAIVVADRAVGAALERLRKGRFASSEPMAIWMRDRWDWAQLKRKQYVRFLWPVTRRQGRGTP